MDKTRPEGDQIQAGGKETKCDGPILVVAPDPLAPTSVTCSERNSSTRPSAKKKKKHEKKHVGVPKRQEDEFDRPHLIVVPQNIIEPHKERTSMRSSKPTRKPRSARKSKKKMRDSSKNEAEELFATNDACSFTETRSRCEETEGPIIFPPKEPPSYKQEIEFNRHKSKDVIENASLQASTEGVDRTLTHSSDSPGAVSTSEPTSSHPEKEPYAQQDGQRNNEESQQDSICSIDRTLTYSSSASLDVVTPEGVGNTDDSLPVMVSLASKEDNVGDKSLESSTILNCCSYQIPIRWIVMAVSGLVVVALIPTTLFLALRTRDIPENVVFSVGASSTSPQNSDPLSTPIPRPRPKKAVKIMERTIVDLGVSSLLSLRTQGTPQQQALRWLASKDQMQLNVSNVHGFIQRYTMVVFYYSTGGKNWSDAEESGFLSASHECSWRNADGRYTSDEIEADGVLECDEHSRVKDIKFYAKGLSGTLPSEIQTFTSLTRLCLWDNSIGGTIPSQLKQLHNLQRLELSGNSFKGTLPPGLGILTKLESLEISGSELSGTIPKLGNLTMLKILTFAHNALTGTISTALGRLSRLELLNLQNNQLRGTVPSSFAEMTAMNEAYFNSNELSGSMNNLCEAWVNITMLWADVKEVTCYCCCCSR